jgi:hypothetical protein
MASGGHSPALSEFRLLFLNEGRRSVNRKVQGSNPWSGANPRIQTRQLRLHDSPPSGAMSERWRLRLLTRGYGCLFNGDWSVDGAGNVETAHTVLVRVDRR